MEEELAQHFYQKLVAKEGQPGVVLTQFFSAFYERTFDAKLIPYFARMVKLYGRNITYLALLDLFDFEDANIDEPRRLISYFVKKRIENQFTVQETEDLSREFKDYLKELKKTGKQKIDGVKDPFDE